MIRLLVLDKTFGTWQDFCFCDKYFYTWKPILVLDKTFGTIDKTFGTLQDIGTWQDY